MFSLSSVFRILTTWSSRPWRWAVPLGRRTGPGRSAPTQPGHPARPAATYRLHPASTLTGALLAIGAPVVASGATSPNNRFADDQGFLRQWGAVARQRDVKRLYIGEANAEAVAAEAPDLILVSAAGNDSALRLVEQLKAIAPVLVVGYDNRSWQQVVELLGQATGREDAASQVVADFDRVSPSSRCACSCRRNRYRPSSTTRRRASQSLDRRLFPGPVAGKPGLRTGGAAGGTGDRP